MHIKVSLFLQFSEDRHETEFPDIQRDISLLKTMDRLYYDLNIEKHGDESTNKYLKDALAHIQTIEWIFSYYDV